MKNVKKKKLFVILLSMLILVNYLFLFDYSLASDRIIETSGLSVIIDYNRYYAFPDLLNMSNGNWLIAYGNGTSHDDTNMFVEGMISTDLGHTWSSVFTIKTSVLGKTSDAELALTENGTVICTFRQGNSDNAGWSVSYDNGTTWHYKGVIDSGDLFHISDMVVVNNVVYGCGYDLQGDHHMALYKTTDNGSSWSLVTDITGEEANDEWGFIALNDTHWIGVAREYPSDGDTWQFETNDSGLTWENFTERSAEFTGEVHSPEFNWLNRDQGVIILHGRLAYDFPAPYYISTTYWISDDNCSTWKNLTTITSGTGGPEADKCDTGYTGYIEFSDYGYMCTYNGTKGGATIPNLYSCYVYDNTSYPSDSSISFISINGNSNGSEIYDSNPTFNWTIVDYSSQYWLQIATDNDFTTLVVNITDINAFNYPLEYSQNETEVSFTLPSANTLSLYGKYYCRVRALSR